MKLAVGLFHFNVQYVAGQTDLYHRYCTEAIGPFLEYVDRRKDWRMSFEVAGHGLEFLDKYYPALLDLLRCLTAEGRIELVSSTYVPSIWPAFPRRDLLKSIELNRECLKSLRLPVTRIFFAHEAFFGPAICELTDYFDVAVCKDDYLAYLCSPEAIRPAYRSGKMLILAGSNHLINELFRRFHSSADPSTLLAAHRDRIEEAGPIASRPNYPCGFLPGIDWRWYHLGSGHNLSTWRRPEDGDDFFYDPDWSRLIEHQMDSYPNNGYHFATVGDLAGKIQAQVTAPLPPLVEGSWDSQGSETVFAWMGRHQNIWEDDAGILGLSWRARNRLVDFESALNGARQRDSESFLDKSLTELWKIQLLAESSDSLGWAPRPKEVDFAREAARSVLTGLAELCAGSSSDPTPAAADAPAAYCSDGPNVPPFVESQLFGAEGEISVLNAEPDLQVLEAWLKPTATSFGVHLHSFPSELVYCPSGLETRPVHIPWDALAPQVIFLALANGLIAIGDGIYLIRENVFGQVAACADKGARRISFMVRGPLRVKRYRWRFFLFRGELIEAVQRANTINRAD